MERSLMGILMNSVYQERGEQIVSQPYSGNILTIHQNGLLRNQLEENIDPRDQ
jgi:hypothetical protein